METIKLENLTFTYEGVSTPTIKDINLSIEKGTINLILGRSGSGKTTLLRQFKSTLVPNGKREGVVFFEGSDSREINPKEEVRRIGYVPQNPNTAMLTDRVYSDLAFVPESLGLSNNTIRQQVAETAHYFELDDIFLKKTNELSGGEKQLVSIASAMVTRPSVLLFDEPTASLDPGMAYKFFNLIKKINEELGTTIIITEQRSEYIFEMADKIFVMEGGNLIISGSTREVIKQLSAFEAFNGAKNLLPTFVKLFSKLGFEPAKCPVTIKDARKLLAETYAGAGASPMAQEERKQRKQGISMDSLKGFVHSESIESIPAESRVTLLDLKSVASRYETGPEVLRNVDLTIKTGEIFCLFGGNGAGKSTIFKTLLGQMPERDGVIKYENAKVRKLPTGAGNVVYIPQDPLTMFTEITVMDEIMSLKAYGLADVSEEEATKTLIKYRLNNLKDLHPYDLSGGQRQLLALAKAFCLKPKLLLMDEPTKGMDPEFKEELQDILKDYVAQGNAALIATHDVEFSANVATTCALLFDGEIATTAEPHIFFGENTLYKTKASAIASELLPGAITLDEVLQRIGEN